VGASHRGKENIVSKPRTTPRPWRREGRYIYAGRKTIAELPCGGVRLAQVDEANGDLLVQAANCHEELVSALKAVIARYGPDATYLESEVWNQARAALAKAEENR
jgi:hypothetical protein